MNSVVSALIISMALGGNVPVDATQPETEQPVNVISTEETAPDLDDITKASQISEAQRLRQEEQDRLKREQEAERLKQEEEERLKKEEEERLKKEEMLANADELNYDHDIASYSTNYSQGAGSANRNFNMLLASDSINGMIIKPGEEFSYNEVILSKRTPERDYKPAGVISGGKLVNATGGGICQISSTLFNAALHSGMTITQRRCHSLRVGYLPAGRDATCSWGSVDFCFRNDLELPVKIESTMENGTIKIRFLSPGDPNIGNIEVKVFQKNGVYTLNRYVDGEVDYTTTSRYK